MSFNAYCEILVCLVLWLGRISSVGLAQAFIVATLILGLRLRVTATGHLAVFHQNLSGGQVVPLQYKFNIRTYKFKRYKCNTQKFNTHTHTHTHTSLGTTVTLITTIHHASSLRSLFHSHCRFSAIKRARIPIWQD